MKRKIFNIFTAVFLFAALASCKNMIETPSNNEHNGKSTLSISISENSSRTIFADDYKFLDMTYTLKGTKDSVKKTIEDDLTYAELTGEKIIILDSGKWDLTLFAGKNDINYYSATLENVEITAGTNNVIFVLKEILNAPQTGSGSLNVKLNFPNDAEVAFVKAGLLKTDWSQVADYEMEVLQIQADSSVTYEKLNVPSGTYVLSVKFYKSDNAEIKPGYSELIQIKDGRTSSAERTLESLEKYHNITYNLNGGTLVSGVLPSSFNEQQTVTLPGKKDVEITRENYAFIGWYDNAECAGEKVTEIPCGTKQDVKLWAGWRPGFSFADGNVSNLSALLSAATEDEVVVVLTGTISSSTISTIASALKANADKKVVLDMSHVSGITSIGWNAFRGCTGLTSVEFVTKEGWYKTSSRSATSGDSIDVTDAEVNATKMKATISSPSDWYNMYLKRNP